MSKWFTKTRNPLPAKKWRPTGKPYSAALSAALEAMQRGDFYACLVRCAQIEAEHGPQPFTQMLAMLIKKDRLGAREEALADAESITKNWPAWPDGQYNYGAFLQEMGRWSEALWPLRKALSLCQDHVPAMVQLGISYAALGKHLEARQIWANALRYEPISVRDEYHLSPIFAARGDFAQFMRLQELRWEAQEFYTHDHGAPPAVMAHAEIWQGDSLEGHDLLVLDEQGAGDTIQFARYLPQLCAQARTVWLRLKQRSLKALIQLIAPSVRILEPDEPMPMVSRVIGLMSLFHRCAMVQRCDPAFPQNYVLADKASTPTKIVGICWAGATSHPRDAQRSMAWEQMLPLLDAFPGCTWVDFTIGRGRADDARISRFQPDDYADTVRALECVDALVTVDTSVAHLAGAMGIPTYVLVTTLPDMRWGVQGERTPWYDSWEIVRQQTPNDWSTVIHHVIGRLQA